MTCLAQKGGQCNWTEGQKTPKWGRGRVKKNTKKKKFGRQMFCSKVSKNAGCGYFIGFEQNWDSLVVCHFDDHNDNKSLIHWKSVP